MPAPQYFIGLISGTSIDAIDCALVRFDKNKLSLQATHSQKFSPRLQKNIFAQCLQDKTNLQSLGQLDIEIGKEFAAAVQEMLRQEQLSAASITAIGSHGQTVFHHPVRPNSFSMQLGDPNTIAFLTGITTVADFRRMDMAAGGQGAPLAPLFHQHFFAKKKHQRVIVNIGGMANLTVIAENSPYLGFDTGPGNVLMDYWIGEIRQLIYDEFGGWASSGKINDHLLTLLLDEDYFRLPPPKSTGRELFNGRWLGNKLAAFGRTVDDRDVQATLLELSAVTIADAIKRHLESSEVYVCGGGAHNTGLMTRIRELLPDCQVATTETLGLGPDWVEAVTFAWLAKQRLELKAVNTGPITGATTPCLLGGIYRAN